MLTAIIDSNSAKIKSVTVLAAERQRLWDEFNSKTVDDEAVDAAIYRKANAIEARLVKATFKTNADKLDGLKILASRDDPEHEYWCTFKAALYTRMLTFA